MQTTVAPVVLVMAVMLGACTAAPAAVDRSAPPGSTSTSAPPLSLPPTTAGTTTTTHAPVTTTTALTAETLDEGKSLAAKSGEPLEVFSQPGDATPVMTLTAATDLGTIRVVSVLEGPIDGWMRVELPVRPNGSEGWIRQSDVEMFVVDRWVEVDIGDRSLTVGGSDGVMLETTVAVGSATSPTPTGRFFVTDSVVLSNPAGPWGPHAFGLSAYSDSITEFNGGDGIIGIHGTNHPSSIGSAASLGCIRVPNDVALQLAEMISAGVPVEIRP